METAKAETTNEMTQSPEMSTLYRAMAVAQANIFLYLRKAADEEDLRKRAAEVAGKLETFIIEYQEFESYKCGNGTVWNPITQQCE